MANISSTVEVKELPRFATKATIKNDICRVCLKQCDNQFYHIFESSFGEYDSISEMFDKVFMQKVTAEDGYPQVVCYDCLEKVLKAVDFMEKLEKSRGCKNSQMMANGKILLVVKSEENESTQYIINDRDKINHDEGMYFCQKCGISFFTIEALSDHMVSCFKCATCQATHTNIADLKIHLNIHRKSQESACPHCGGLLKRGFHSYDSFHYPCSECHFRFPCILFLNQHIEAEHRNETTAIPKDVGAGSNMSKEDTNMTWSREREQECGGYKCTLCNKHFNTLAQATSHSLSLKCLYVCDLCGANYRFKSQLKIHMMDKHLGIRPHLCCVCGKSFVRRGMLLSHQQIHRHENTFQCGVCNKKFASVATLRYHSRLHTGEKPYMCSVCGEGFVKSSRLKEHEQKWHIGKLQCPQCMTTFSQRSSLKTHMDRFHPNMYNRKGNYLIEGAPPGH